VLRGQARLPEVDIVPPGFQMVWSGKRDRCFPHQRWSRTVCLRTPGTPRTQSRGTQNQQEGQQKSR
jgi:hypothetical protein